MIRDFLNKGNDSNNNNNNNTKKYFYLNLIIIAIMFVISLFFIKKLPAEIPIMHDGPRQIYVDSKLGVFLIPTIALITCVLFNVQKRVYKFHSIIYLFVLIGMTIYYYTLI